MTGIDRYTLVVLSPGFPASEADTACLPSQQLFIRTLTQNYPRLDVIVIAFQYPFVEKTYNWYGATVIACNGRNRGHFFRRMLWRKVWMQLENLSKQRRLMGILSFWYSECCYLGSRFAASKSLPHQCWISGQDARPGNKDIDRTGAGRHELVAMSDFLRNEFEKNYGIRPAHVIPNGIQLPKPSNARRTIDVIGVGSLIPLKQFDVFIDMVCEVKARFPHINAVICGKGPQQQILERAIRKNGLEKNIRLLGELDHSEVLSLMQASRLLLHPSSYEGFSTVCLEALAAGTPVVSFCRAMDHTIPHWHIAADRAEMKRCLLQLLEGKIDHRPVVPYTMRATAAKMMRLFFNKGMRHSKQLVADRFAG